MLGNGDSQMTLTWLEASKLNVGDRVVFVTSHDIFAEDVIVPEGMTATVTEQGLNDLATALYVTPDDEAIRTKLAAWDGMIQLVPGLDREYANREHEWQALSPIGRAA